MIDHKEIGFLDQFSYRGIVGLNLGSSSWSVLCVGIGPAPSHHGACQRYPPRHPVQPGQLLGCMEVNYQVNRFNHFESVYH